VRGWAGRVSIPIPSEGQARIEPLVRGGATAGSILLTVGGVAMDKPTAAAYGIYPGLPQGVTPNDQSDYSSLLSIHSSPYGWFSVAARLLQLAPVPKAIHDG
jgi:hypothetical protein